MATRGFYHLGNKLMLELNVSEGATVDVEIERTVDGKTVRNEDAYARFPKEIAEYKAKHAPAHAPAVSAPKPAPKHTTAAQTVRRRGPLYEE